jgi:glycosyltransferase involved in cell wall biosynthesis
MSFESPKNVKISVATVVFNAKDLILKTLESVENQDYKNIEYIVVDGGSSDGTLEIINSKKSFIHMIITQPDKGIYDAMNKAAGLATGEFLLFMNAGDIFFSEDTVSDFVQKGYNDGFVYYGDAIYMDRFTGNAYLRGGFFTKYRLSKTNICHQTIFFSKEVYKSISYNLRYKMNADWALNIQIYRKIKYVYLDMIIAFYDSTGLSSITCDNNFKRDQKKIILKYLGFDAILYLVYNKIRNLIF